jgi:hypothetical protein
MLKTHDGWAMLDVATTGLPANDVVAVEIAPDGTVWVATEGFGVGRYDPREFPPTPTATSDAASPTPSATRSATPTRGSTEATPTRVGSSETPTSRTPATPTRTRTLPAGGYRLFAPTVQTRHR